MAVLVCDEEKPRCQKCISRDVKCTYPQIRSLIWVDDVPASAKVNREGKKDSNDPLPPVYSLTPPNEQSSTANTLNLENIDLIIHWFTKTVHTVNPTSNPAAVEICQTLILNQAMKHPFLLHGLLALSALHYAESHADPQKYIEIATSHHTQGLTLYRSILPNISEQNTTASIAFSSLTAMFAFGLARPVSVNAESTELLDDLVQIFVLAKGWHTIVNVAGALQPTRASIFLPLPEIKDNTLSADAEAAFNQLYALNQDQTIPLYTQAISSLKTVFQKVEQGENDNPHLALEWGNSVSQEFMQMIRTRDSLALVIVGFSCVIFEKVPQVWLLKGWSRGLFGVVWREVDPVFRGVLEWPRGMIGFEV
ncbi:hypothetical protein SBOR_2893 [Sclerotinia borealis F-4128]|uniref:Zn(2)-C6 fungal-type domain-containing protein n=1 Tax=Sclerotinia borealis (strain F-4128) TaxID=1432307 RepID=W9CQ53_SCLBF|nr:hypothetical protein SBOR_2893 [Sclerotinia borealis F-4128]